MVTLLSSMNFIRFLITKPAIKLSTMKSFMNKFKAYLRGFTNKFDDRKSTTVLAYG